MKYQDKGASGVIWRLLLGPLGVGPLFTGGDTGAIGSAAIFAASNIFSWGEALLVPGIQATANLLLMERQKDDYDDIVRDQRALVGIAVNNYITGVDSLLPDIEAAYPDVPEVAEYVPIDACCMQRATIECNISTTGRADVYARQVNRLHEQNDVIRSIVFDPRFLENMDVTSLTISDLLRGRSPVGDVVEVLTDNAEQAALTGRIGNTRRTTARDLGLSKLRAQAAGRRELHDHQASINRDVSPISRQVDIREMMQTPAQRIALALTQAQLLQNSLQNVYTAAAQKDPYLMGQLRLKLDRLLLKLQHEANKATLVNQFVPNYAAILQPQIQRIAQAIGDPIGAASNTGYFGDPAIQSGFGQAGVTGGKSGPYHAASDRPDFL
jgi:hypothetical protein